MLEMTGLSAPPRSRSAPLLLSLTGLTMAGKALQDLGPRHLSDITFCKPLCGWLFSSFMVLLPFLKHTKLVPTSRPFLLLPLNSRGPSDESSNGVTSFHSFLFREASQNHSI